MNIEKLPVAPAKDLDADPNTQVLVELRRRSRRSFLVAGAAALATWGTLRWSNQAAGGIGQGETRQQRAVRKVMDWNASVSRAVFGERALAPGYPASMATRQARTNGTIGIDGGLKLDSWRLQVVGLADARSYPEYVSDVDTWVYESTNDGNGDSPFVTDTDTNKSNGSKSKSPEGLKISRATADALPSPGAADPLMDANPGLLLTMEHIRKLPHVEMVTELKCIEGWSQIVHWGGVRFSDFAEAYKPATPNGKPLRYVSLETPSGDYYVGLERLSILHPQTLLCYQMNGAPLTAEHGAPLRLVTSLKYGIKQLKQIGKITFTNERPKDYWAEQGYDWYAGL